MRFYKDNKGNYWWEIDRFHLFTDSEKCSLLEALKDLRRVYSLGENKDKKGGLVEMVDNMIKEVEESIDAD